MSSVAVFSKASPFDALQRWLPKLVLAPSMFIVLVGFYGYILWTFVLSFSSYLSSKRGGLAGTAETRTTGGSPRKRVTLTVGDQQSDDDAVAVE